VIKFFKTPADFRRWLEQNHLRTQELLVGFYKKDSGRPSITWEESVDQALCFGWIDGIRKNRDENSYTIRFTPRKTGSTWSHVNIKRVAKLSRRGLMTPTGLHAFEKRDKEKTKLYSHETKIQKLSAARERKFESREQAWQFFQAQAPTYQRLAIHWVESAKQEDTRDRRFAILIRDSERGKRLEMTTKWSKKRKRWKG